MTKELSDKIVEQMKSEDWTSFVIVAQKTDGNIFFFKNGVSASLLYGMSSLLSNVAESDMENLSGLLVTAIKSAASMNPVTRLPERNKH